MGQDLALFASLSVSKVIIEVNQRPLTFIGVEPKIPQ
jgi:hypothetical protein